MSKFFTNKGKRRGAAIVALALTATLSLGLFSACTEPKEEEKETPASKADTQLIKNGNFEFYSDNNQTDKKDCCRFRPYPTAGRARRVRTETATVRRPPT